MGTLMDVEQAVQIAGSVFDPLAQRLRLRGPHRTSYSHSVVSLSYQTEGIGLEIEIDMFSFFMFVLLFRPQGDAPPVGYRDDRGRRQTLYLQEALRELGIDTAQEDDLLRQLKGNAGHCEAMATTLAAMVERTWEAVSASPSRWFGSAEVYDGSDQ